MFARRVLLSLAAASAALPAAAAPARSAEPAFGTPITLRAPSHRVVGTPSVAVGPTGRVVAGWHELAEGAAQVVVRRGGADGRFSRAERLTRSGYAPVVAAGSGGGAAAVWLVIGPGSRRALRMAAARGPGRFGRARTLVSTRAAVTSHQVVAMGTGYVVLWWQEARGRARSSVRYAVADARGRLGRVLTLSSPAGPPAVVAAPDGTATAAWPARPGGATAGGEAAVRYARIGPGAARFGGVRTVAPAQAGRRPGILAVHVAAGPGGTGLGWTESLPGTDAIRAALLAADGTASPETVTTVATAGSPQRAGQGPALALPGGGAPPVAAWAELERSASGGLADGRILAAAREADGGYEAPARLSTGDGPAFHALAAATRSTSVVVWTTRTGPLEHRLWSAAREGAGPFGAARPLSRAGHAELGAVLAASPAVAAVAWNSRSSAGRRGVTLAVLADGA